MGSSVDPEPKSSSSDEDSKNNVKRRPSELLMLKRTYSDEPLQEDVKEELKKCPTLRQTWTELNRQSHIGAPIAAMNIMWFARFIISTLFLGHVGGLELAGGTLALTFANVVGFSILHGLSGGMEPICSQAYGAHQFDTLGLTLQRTILLLLLTSLPLSGAWYRAQPLLLFFGQNQAISKIAQQYLLYLLPDLVATSFLAPLRIFLRSQCITTPLMTFSIIAMSLHIPLNYLLVFKLDMGAPGTALAICFTDFNLMVMLLLYIRYSRVCKDSWTGWSKASLSGWDHLLKLAIPSCLMACMEGWCYEIMVLLTGLLPHSKEAVETVAIVLNGDTLLYALQVALASCVCTRVGNELGAKRPLAAYHATIAALSVSTAIGCAGAAWLICSRFMWGKFFTTDSTVIQSVAQVLPIMALMELGNFPQTVACGVLRGSARPALGALINLGAFYMLGIPVGILLGFKYKMGLLGLWIGLATAVAATAVMSVTLVLRTDWIKQALRAHLLITTSQDNCNSAYDVIDDNRSAQVPVLGNIRASLEESLYEENEDQKTPVHQPDVPCEEELLSRKQKQTSTKWESKQGGGSREGETVPTDEQENAENEEVIYNEEEKSTEILNYGKVADQYADGNWKKYRERRGSNKGSGAGWEVSLSMMNESMRKCTRMVRSFNSSQAAEKEAYFNNTLADKRASSAKDPIVMHANHSPEVAAAAASDILSLQLHPQHHHNKRFVLKKLKFFGLTKRSKSQPITEHRITS